MKHGKNGNRSRPTAHDYQLNRDFTADDVNELWLAGIPPHLGGTLSEHPTSEGKLYLCAIKDVFSGRIVGYLIASRMKARIAVRALDIAASRRRDISG